MSLMGELWTHLGSAIASIAFFWVMFQKYIPSQVESFIEKYFHKVLNLFSPYMQITFTDYGNDSFRHSQAYANVETYLASMHTSRQAKRLKAEMGSNGKTLTLTIDDYEEVVDKFKGITLWWSSTKYIPPTPSVSVYPPSSSTKRFLKLTFHRQHRDIVTGAYLPHVMEEAKAISVKNRQRKLFTNGAGSTWTSQGKCRWNHVKFHHPATFETLAMDPKKKEEIIDDLVTFTKAKDYYAKIGKTWKRGYLLYGPPGTGKSTMIGAMANFLNYDVYDLELTAVKDNTELRKLLIDTTNKSIVVIEDIDCSLDLTGQRSSKCKEETQAKVQQVKHDIEKEGSKVTLSGLLNMIDGLWSACEGERIVVFTTNHIDKLDAALIRRGRMDKHIEMCYCKFQAFKVLVKNYWDLDEHLMFETIKNLLDEVDMTPADVSEHLMPKCYNDNVETRLASLVDALVKGQGTIKLSI